MSTVITGDTGVSKVQDGVVVQADLDVAIVPIGVGQTWQDVKTTPGRTLGTTYTNSTGRPIQLMVTIYSSASSRVKLTINSVDLSTYGSNGAGTAVVSQITPIIPDGATYAITTVAGTNTLDAWTELR